MPEDVNENMDGFQARTRGEKRRLTEIFTPPKCKWKLNLKTPIQSKEAQPEKIQGGIKLEGAKLIFGKAIAREKNVGSYRLVIDFLIIDPNYRLFD